MMPQILTLTLMERRQLRTERGISQPRFAKHEPAAHRERGWFCEGHVEGAPRPSMIIPKSRAGRDAGFRRAYVSGLWFSASRGKHRVTILFTPQSLAIM